MTGQNTIQEAVMEYINAVKTKSYPAPEHTFK
jgi:ketopantoate hydroxymethyltransferase